MVVVDEEKIEEALKILNEAVERGFAVMLKPKQLDKNKEIIALADIIERSRRCLYQALGKE